MAYKDLRKSLVLEYFGTLSLVTLAASTAILSFQIPGMNPYIEHVLIAITVGLVVGLATFLFGEVSGAHINPSVSLSHSIAGIMPRKWFFAYFAAQMIAAVTAGIILHFVYQSVPSPTHFGLTKIQEGATQLTGAFLEFGGTIVLTYVALVMSTRLKGKKTKQALVGALLIFALTVIIGPFTGASFNPSRSFGPAVASMDFENQYIYWIAPLGGAAISALVFYAKNIRKEKKLSSEETQIEEREKSESRSMKKISPSA